MKKIIPLVIFFICLIGFNTNSKAFYDGYYNASTSSDENSQDILRVVNRNSDGTKTMYTYKFGRKVAICCYVRPGLTNKLCYYIREFSNIEDYTIDTDDDSNYVSCYKINVNDKYEPTSELEHFTFKFEAFTKNDGVGGVNKLGGQEIYHIGAISRRLSDDTPYLRIDFDADTSYEYDVTDCDFYYEENATSNPLELINTGYFLNPSNLSTLRSSGHIFNSNLYYRTGREIVSRFIVNYNDLPLPSNLTVARDDADNFTFNWTNPDTLPDYPTKRMNVVYKISYKYRGVAFGFVPSFNDFINNNYHKVTNQTNFTKTIDLTNSYNLPASDILDGIREKLEESQGLFQSVNIQYTSSVFYIQYFFLDETKGRHYSSWIKVTFNYKDDSYKMEIVNDEKIDSEIGGSGDNAEVIGGSIGSNDDIITDDYYNGTSNNFDYSDLGTGNIWSILTSFANGIGSVPKLFANLYSFLPGYVIGILGVCVAMICVIRFLGR